MVSKSIILEAYNQGPDAVVALVFDICSQFEKRISELESNAKKNSQNSHKPPSSDGLGKCNVTNTREKTDKKSGGQPGHKGHTLHQVENPNVIVTDTPEICTGCQTSLDNIEISGKKIRQVFDIPPIQFQVTQYEVESKVCPNCLRKNEGEFPIGVTNQTQYGPNVKKLAVYLTYRQSLSLKRTSEFFRDVFGRPINESTVNSILKNVSADLIPVANELENYILSSSVAYCDETGIRNKGKTEWVHTFSTHDATIQHVHPKRGFKAMEEINLIPQFTGRIMHDCWASYDKFTHCQHSVCNVHLLRELKGIYENKQECWAKEMIEFLVTSKKIKEAANGCLTLESLIKLQKRFQEILTKAMSLHPFQEKKDLKKGRQKQTRERNLIGRFIKYEDSILAFLDHPNIPFDNNQAERDIRPIKLRMKNSGSFRSDYGAENYLRVSSIFHTLIKQGKSIFGELDTFIRTGTLNILPNSN